MAEIAVEPTATSAIAYNTSSGETIWIEITPEPEKLVPPSREGTAANVADITAKIEDAGSAIVSVCASLYAKVHSGLANAKPKEFEIEFGVNLAGEAGIPLVTKGTAECTFKVTAKWELTN